MTAILNPPVEQITKTAEAVETRKDRRWLGLFAVLAATIMNLLDSTVVNVAAPSIRAELGGTYASLQWIAAGYTLALAVGLLTGGRLGDMYGRKPMMLAGVTGFMIASLACAIAPSPEVLIASRVLQGLFGAVMIPQAFGLIRDMFTAEHVGKAYAAFGPIIGLSTILGPVVAGLLIDADIAGTGWRMIFLMNLPLGAFSLIAGVKALPAPTRQATKGIDIKGVLIGATGMFLLVYPLVQGRELGWPVWSMAMVAASVPVLAVFAVYQLTLKRSGRTPLVELSVLRKRSYASGVLFVVVFFGSLAGFSLAVGLFLQLGLGYSPMRASLTMAAWAIGAFLGSGFGSAMMNKLGRHVLHIGLSLMTVGSAALTVVLHRAGVDVGGWDLAAPLVTFGIGMGMIFVPLFDIIMGEVADHEVGSAAGILESIQQLAASLGVAILGTLFFGVIGAQATQHFDASAEPRLRVELAAEGVPAADRDRVVAAVRACVVDRENATDPDTVPASCANVPNSAPIVAAGIDTHQRSSLAAAERTALVTLILTVLAIGLGFLLPRKARAGH